MINLSVGSRSSECRLNYSYVSSHNTSQVLRIFTECTIFHAKVIQWKVKWKRPIRRICRRFDQRDIPNFRLQLHISIGARWSLRFTQSRYQRMGWNGWRITEAGKFSYSEFKFEFWTLLKSTLWILLSENWFSNSRLDYNLWERASSGLYYAIHEFRYVYSYWGFKILSSVFFSKKITHRIFFFP